VIPRKELVLQALDIHKEIYLKLLMTSFEAALQFFCDINSIFTTIKQCLL